MNERKIRYDCVGPVETASVLRTLHLELHRVACSLGVCSKLARTMDEGSKVKSQNKLFKMMIC